MTHLDRLRERLREMSCHGIWVPSTDEYLSEFTQPFSRRLAWTTGFSGSMGLSVVLLEQAALFLDSRYRAQGERDTRGLGIEVLDATESTRQCWLTEHMRPGQRLAVDTRLQPHADVERLAIFAGKRGIEIVELDTNPIDELWGTERPNPPTSPIFDYPVRFAGMSAAQKCTAVAESLENSGIDCCLLTDPEDVAWLLNVRTRERSDMPIDSPPIVPIPLSRALVTAQGEILWFIEHSRLEPSLLASLEGRVTVMDPKAFDWVLENRLKGKSVAANLRTTPHRFAAIAARRGHLTDDPIIARRRWIKNAHETERAREGHYLDGQAIIRFMAWLDCTVAQRTVTEIEAAEKLVELRRAFPEYQGPSMPVMSASGPNGAMPHYTPSVESNRKLNEHPIYWMDSAAQYLGCSTDNTVCLAVGHPESRHIRAHTLVVKGFVALSTARFPQGIASTQLDSFARQFLWREGLDYGHGTGHGVGNFMNIHEGPYIRKEPLHPMVAPMEAGMIVSNEPAYYSKDDFGIRVESHLLSVPSRFEGFLEFETLSRLPIDPRLIDPALLTQAEKRWLMTYHDGIEEGYRDVFDEETARWLASIAACYRGIANG